VRASELGEGSPGLREMEGEDGEGFSIAQSGRGAYLPISPGGGEVELGRGRCDIGPPALAGEPRRPELA
jgi:hypothetical protein